MGYVLPFSAVPSQGDKAAHLVKQQGWEGLKSVLRGLLSLRDQLGVTNHTWEPLVHKIEHIFFMKNVMRVTSLVWKRPWKYSHPSSHSKQVQLKSGASGPCPVKVWILQPVLEYRTQFCCLRVKEIYYSGATISLYFMIQKLNKNYFNPWHLCCITPEAHCIRALTEAFGVIHKHCTAIS